MNLSKKIKNYRAAHNVSQMTLAELCNVSYATINKAEQGRMVSFLTEAKIRRIVDEQNGNDIVND